MRTVADHHVDRPEMHAQQCAQLTGTNRPIGLIRSSDGKGDRLRASASRDRAPAFGWRSCTTLVVRLAWNRGLVVCPGDDAPAMFSQRGSRSGLVAIGCATHPIPSRTRPLSAQPPMVLRPKTRESRSPPDLTGTPPHDPNTTPGRHARARAPGPPDPPDPGRTTTRRGVEQPGSSSGS